MIAPMIATISAAATATPGGGRDSAKNLRPAGSARISANNPAIEMTSIMRHIVSGRANRRSTSSPMPTSVIVAVYAPDRVRDRDASAPPRSR